MEQKGKIQRVRLFAIWSHRASIVPQVLECAHLWTWWGHCLPGSQMAWPQANRSGVGALGCPPFLSLTLSVLFFFIGLSDSGLDDFPYHLGGVLPFLPIWSFPEGGGRPEGLGSWGFGIISNLDLNLSLQESIPHHWSAEKLMHLWHMSSCVQDLRLSIQNVNPSPFWGRTVSKVHSRHLLLTRQDSRAEEKHTI